MKRGKVWRVLTLFAILPVLVLAVPGIASAQEAVKVSKWQQNGLRFEIAPLGADQVRAFFIGRGFSSQNAGLIAKTGCIFRSAIGNTGTSVSDPDVEIDLSRWQVVSQARTGAPQNRGQWAATWKERGANEDAQTAFYWAMFPGKQVFSPTDYNWGMLSFALPPGTSFELNVVWKTGKIHYSKKLENLTCGR